MTILITGGAGFIGSYVNQLLNKKGFKTVVLDDFSYGIVQCDPFILGDIADTLLVKKIIHDFDVKAVMHFAAHITVKESVLNPAKYYFNNVAKTVAFLSALQEMGVDKCVFSSSAAVYGTPLQEKIDEWHPLSPINPYGHSKLMCEQVFQDFDLAYNMKYISLRYFNACGGDPSHVLKPRYNFSHLIPRALEGDKISVFGTDWGTRDGSGIRDYIHVHDLATAHILSLERLLSDGPSNIYNLGTGIGYSVFEVLSAVESVTNRKLQIQIGERRPGDPPILVADSRKAQKELGWEPLFPSINKMIEDAWATISCIEKQQIR